MLLFLLFLGAKVFSGCVVVIQGIPSSGKTSMAFQLKNMLQYPTCEIVHTDTIGRTMILQMAKKLKINLEKESSHWFDDYTAVFKRFSLQQIIQYWQDFYEEVHRQIHAAYKRGSIVIVDTIIWSNRNEFLQAMKNIPVFWVLLYTPLQKVIEFVEMRNALERRWEKRSLFVSLFYYEQMFCCAQSLTDIPLETVRINSLFSCLDYMNNEPNWYYLKPEDFEQNFINKFNVTGLDQIRITSPWQYDVIVHGSELPIPQRACLLKDQIQLLYQSLSK